MFYKNDRKVVPGDVVTGQNESGKTVTGRVVGVHHNGKDKVAELNIAVEPPKGSKIGTGSTTMLVKSNKFLHQDDAPESTDTVASPAVAKTGTATDA